MRFVSSTRDCVLSAPQMNVSNVCTDGECVLSAPLEIVFCLHCNSSGSSGRIVNYMCPEASESLHSQDAAAGASMENALVRHSSVAQATYGNRLRKGKSSVTNGAGGLPTARPS